MHPEQLIRKHIVARHYEAALGHIVGLNPRVEAQRPAIRAEDWLTPDPYFQITCATEGSIRATGTTAAPVRNWDDPQVAESTYKAYKALVDRLRIDRRIAKLESENKSLLKRLKRLEEALLEAKQQPVSLTITTLAPDPYDVLQPFSITIQKYGDAFVASLPEANLGVTADTEHQAIEDLKDVMIITHEMLAETDEAELGPGPKKQKAVLSKMIRENCSANGEHRHETARGDHSQKA